MWNRLVFLFLASLFVSSAAAQGINRERGRYPPAGGGGDPIGDNCTIVLDVDPGNGTSARCGASLCGSGDEDVRVDSILAATDGASQRFLQATSTRRPTWNWQDSRGNSKHSLSFNDGELRNLEDDGSYATNQPFTVYIVAEDTSGAFTTSYLIGNDNVGTYSGGRFSDRDLDVDFGALLSTGVDVPTDIAVYTLVVNGTSSGIYVNDGNHSSATGDLGTNNIQSMTLGNYDGANQGWDGPIWRWLVCSGAHDATARDAITDFFGTEYGITGLPD